MVKVAIGEGEEYVIEQGENETTINGSPAVMDIRTAKNGLISMLAGEESYTAIVEKIDAEAKEVYLRVNGQLFVAHIREEIDLLLEKMGLNLTSSRRLEPVKAPMPGMVLKVLVEVGQTIEKGDRLIILEAMKMENVLKASASATVKAIKVSEHTAVEKGAVLIELE